MSSSSLEHGKFVSAVLRVFRLRPYTSYRLLFVPIRLAQLPSSHQTVFAALILTGSFAYHNDEQSR